MSPNEFDKLVTDKFDQSELPYNPANWERLSRALPGQKPRVIAFTWQRVAGIAASLLVIIASATFFFQQRNDQTQPLEDQRTAQQSSNIPGVTPPSIPVVNEDIQEQQATPVMNSKVMVATNHRRAQPAPEEGVTPATVLPIAKTPATQSAETAKPVVPQEQIAFKPATKAPKEFVTLQPKPAQRSNTGSKTNISLTGGLNYGSLNTGYMAGVNAKHQFSNRMYLESDLAVVSNQATQATLHPTQVNSFNSGTAASKSSIETREGSFVYLQVNPSVGYQLHERFSISVGGDMQKLLEQNLSERTHLTADGDAQVIPDLDLGLTGKTEFAITPKLKAGLLYREGVNNIMYGGNDYLERRYMQVQLKYRILGR